MPRSRQIAWHWRAALSFALALAIAPAEAQQAPPGTESFDLPAQRLDVALTAFARQTHCNLVFDPTTVERIRAPELRGVFTPQAALGRLLADSGLTATFTGPRYAVVYSATAAAHPSGGRNDAAGYTIVLDLAEVRGAARPRIGRSDPTGDAYAAMVVGEIRRLLQRDLTYRAGPLQILLGIGTDRSGRISEVRLAHGNGEAVRERTLKTTLEGHRLALAPPVDLVQPMWFSVVVERSPSAATGRRQR